MRASCRILLSHSAIVVLLLTFRVGTTLAQTSSAPNQPAQSASAAQNLLPPKWNEAVRALAEKIAAAAGTTHEVSMEVKNISSLNVAEAKAIQQELQRELEQRDIRLSSLAQGEMSVHVTLSEGVEGYMWSAETRRGDASQTFVAGVPRQLQNTDGLPIGSLRLDAQLIWAQPEEFIDFALAKPGNSDSTLNILGLNHFETYKFSDSSWRMERTIPISRMTPVRRGGAGGFDLRRLDTFWFDVDCIGPAGEPKNMTCSMWYSITPAKEVGINVRGREESVGEILRAKCGANSILISSGPGDWTQPDFVQGFLLMGPTEEAVPSGSPIPFDGPILNMRPDWKENTLRMIAHNLKTGNYEGYLVTATCGD